MDKGNLLLTPSMKCLNGANFGDERSNNANPFLTMCSLFLNYRRDATLENAAIIVKLFSYAINSRLVCAIQRLKNYLPSVVVSSFRKFKICEVVESAKEKCAALSTSLNFLRRKTSQQSTKGNTLHSSLFSSGSSVGK